jgi:uncharacterized membrane protein
MSMINYFVFVKEKKFNDSNFKKEFLGGLAVIIYMIFTALLLIYIIRLSHQKALI